MGVKLHRGFESRPLRLAAPQVSRAAPAPPPLPRGARRRDAARRLLGELVRGDREDDVTASEAEIRVQLDGAALERRHGHVGERYEVALGGVEHARDTAAVAVPRERQQALDPVALGLDPDPLVAVVDPGLVLVLWRGLIAHVPI